MVPAILAKVDCAGSGRRHPQEDSGGTLTSGWGVLLPDSTGSERFPPQFFLLLLTWQRGARKS